jgi:predicted secreted protein
MTDFEVSDTIDIEELVPVVLTSDEEVVKITAYKKEITQKKTAVIAFLEEADAETNIDFIAKIEVGLIQIETLTNAINKSSDFLDIKTQATEAIELADDLLVVLEKNNLPNVSELEALTLVDELSIDVASSTATSTVTATSTTSTSTSEELPGSEPAATSSSTQEAPTTTAETQ